MGSNPISDNGSLIAQLVERTAVNREVVGSIPAGGASDRFVIG